MSTEKKRKTCVLESDEDVAHLFSFAKRRNRILKKALELFAQCDLEVVNIIFSPASRVSHFAPNKRTKDVMLQWLNSKKIQTGELQLADPEQLINVLEILKRKTKNGNNKANRDSYKIRKQINRVQQYILDLQSNIRTYEPLSNSLLFTEEANMHEAFLQEVQKSVEANMNQSHESNPNSPGGTNQIADEESYQSAQMTMFGSEEPDPDTEPEIKIQQLWALHHQLMYPSSLIVSEGGPSADDHVLPEFIIIPPFPIPIQPSDPDLEQEANNMPIDDLVDSEIFNLYGSLGYSSVPSFAPAKHFNFHIVVAPPDLHLPGPVAPKVAMFESTAQFAMEDLLSETSGSEEANMIEKSEASCLSIDPDNMPNLEAEQVIWDIKADGYFPVINDEMPFELWQSTNNPTDSRVHGEANDETLYGIDELDCMRDAMENPFIAMLLDMDTPDGNFGK